MVPQNARGRHDLPSRKDDKCQAEIGAVQTGARRIDCMISDVNKHRSGPPTQMTAMPRCSARKFVRGGVRVGADRDPGCLPNSRNRSTGWPHVAPGSNFGAYSREASLPAALTVLNSNLWRFRQAENAAPKARRANCRSTLAAHRSPAQLFHITGVPTRSETQDMLPPK